jgi:aminoglycoside 2'-N-acetyltransferase I
MDGVSPVRAFSTDELGPERVTRLRALFDVAWRDGPDGFTDLDWDHAVGGVHFLVEDGDRILSHASVVERALEVDGRPLATGYVEAVATLPSHQRRGHGSAVMRAAGEHIDRTFELGALATGEVSFYERLGWVVWKGPTFVRTARGPVPTPEEDGSVMVRRSPRTPELDLSAPISCDWRPGDVW